MELSPANRKKGNTMTEIIDTADIAQQMTEAQAAIALLKQEQALGEPPFEFVQDAEIVGDEEVVAPTPTLN